MSSKSQENSATAITRERDALRLVVLRLWESPFGTADIRREFFDEAMKAAGLAEERRLWSNGRRPTVAHMVLTDLGERTLRLGQALDKTSQNDRDAAP